MLGELLLFSILAVSPPPASPARVAFLENAVRANFSEVTLGRIIAARGYTPSVRRFGALLVHDHSIGLAQAQRLAARLRVNIQPALTPNARIEQQRLQRLGGRWFDREVRRYMVLDHRSDIREFRSEVHRRDRLTIGYAAASIPVMERHLAIAKAIAG